MHLLPARREARPVALAEALRVLEGLSAEALGGGPAAEVGDVFWVRVPAADERALEEAPYHRLGYTRAVDRVVPLSDGEARGGRADAVRWKRRYWRLERLYEADAEEVLRRGPDQRPFALEVAPGVVHGTRGYRGDGSDLGRRALPVCDAQMLVNLVFPGEGGVLLDPFAGAGGIVQEAVRCGLEVWSNDADPILRPGLEAMGARHNVGDARSLPYGDAAVDAVATEPPYAPEAADVLPAALSEMRRVLKPGRTLALLCAEWQADLLRSEAARQSLRLMLDVGINRKGSPCHALWMGKPPE